MLRTFLIVLVLAPSLIADDATKAKKLSFEVHSGYFVSNKAKLDGASSYRVIKDKKSFDQIFGVGFVMNDRSNRLKPNAFDAHIVLSTIKKGKSIWKYKVTTLIARGKTLTVKYQATAGNPGTASFVSPMIVSVPRGEWKKIVFVENGKTVKTVK